jgi:hypothetical protein
MSSIVQSPPSARIENDAAKNRFLRRYLLALGGAGVVLGGLTHVFEWGFFGWFAAGLLLLSGFGGLAGLAKGGGAGIARCSSCNGAVEVMGLTEHHTLPCPHCGTYLEGAGTLVPVQADRVTERPSFEAPLPARFAWPPGCPVCRGAVTRTKKVEGMSGAGAFALVAAPIAVVGVTSVDAPACDRHDDGVSLFRGHAGPVVAFRSFAYFREFCALNGITGSRTIAGVAGTKPPSAR